MSAGRFSVPERGHRQAGGSIFVCEPLSEESVPNGIGMKKNVADRGKRGNFGECLPAQVKSPMIR
jgi:hypothetical protein